MICKCCGKETSTVICSNCGMNVVWYNKYGYQHDIENPGELNQYYDVANRDGESIENILQDIFEPDGSGD